jgi:hypothetical protein
VVRKDKGAVDCTGEHEGREGMLACSHCSEEEVVGRYSRSWGGQEAALTRENLVLHDIHHGIESSEIGNGNGSGAVAGLEVGVNGLVQV